MRFVQLAQEIAPGLDDGRRQILGRLQVQQRQSFGAEPRALIDGRQPTGLPVLREIDGQPLRIVQHDVGGQVLIDRAQAIRHPRAERRASRQSAAGLHQIDRRLMIEVLAVHGPDERHIVADRAQLRHQLRHLHAGLAVALELERRGHHHADLAGELDLAEDVAARRFPRVFLERGLGVEQIHLAGSAIHEQVDDRFRLRLEVRAFRRHVVARGPGPLCF